MKILYGTGNNAKLESMKKDLQGMDITIIGLQETGKDCPNVDETGNDPLENAQAKALAYYKFFQMPVFSCDSGLFIEGLPKDKQPGVNVRTVAGKRLTDDEMISYYSSLVKEVEKNNSCIAEYRNAICLVLDDKHSFSYMGDDISGEKFILSSVPHIKRREGFPLDSLSIHIPTGQYYFDLDKRRSSSIEHGFRNFFKKALEVQGEHK